MEGEENTHLKGTEPAQAQLSGHLLYQLGADPAPDRAVMAREQRGSPATHHTQTLAPPTPVTCHTKVTVNILAKEFFANQPEQGADVQLQLLLGQVDAKLIQGPREAGVHITHHL